MHIRKRGNSKFQCIVKFKNKCISKTFNNLKECKQWGYQLEFERDNLHNLSVQKNLTLKDLLEDYLQKFTPTLKDKGLSNQIKRIITHYPYLVHKKVLDIEPIDFINYKKVRVKDIGNYNSYKNNYKATNKDLVLFKTIFNIAINFKGLKIENPLKLIKKFPETKGKYRPINGYEHRIILKNSTIMKKAIILILRHTGARPIEVFNLEWTHLNQYNNEIHIDWEISKNNYSRIIPVKPFLIKWLKKNLDISSNKVIEFNKESFRIWLSKLTQKWSFYDLTMYDYRRNFIRYQANRNMPLPKLALMTGHRSYEMLARYYGHFVLRNVG